MKASGYENSLRAHLENICTSVEYIFPRLLHACRYFMRRSFGLRYFV